jgi:tetratricopeptide (TPR) repeat protein
MLLFLLAAHAETVVVYLDGRPFVAELVTAVAMEPLPAPASPASKVLPASSLAVVELLMTMPAYAKDCRSPSEAIRQAARKQVELGDEARMTSGDERAVKDYLAALSMDPCNGYAWFGLAQVAAEAGRPDLALKAAQPATELLPNHYGAWTLLGRQYELLGHKDLAKGAYMAALALSPNYAEARAGMARLQ